MICAVCAKQDQDISYIEDDTCFFCSVECLEKSKIWCDIWCPYCQEYFFSEDEWEGQCIYCKRHFYTYEECLEDYSDCWDVKEFY